MQPLNGTKTHPLTAHAIKALDGLKGCPKPCNLINPGVANRLMRGDLIEIRELPSPFITHKGKPIQHYAITEAGRKVLADKGARDA